MTPKQLRFVAEYRACGNASEAARRAGYAATGAGPIGSALMRHPEVLAALREAGIEITHDPSPEKAPRTGRRYRQGGLTLLQQRFVEEYLVDGNATQAAIRAGLPSRRPAHAGAKMMARPAVAAAIERERLLSAERTRVTRARVVKEMARIAFANMGDFADWGPDGMTLTPRAALSRDDRAAVAEITSRPGKHGPRLRVRLHAKRHALDGLARALGLYGRGGAHFVPDEEADAERTRRAEEARVAIRNRLLRIASGADTCWIPPAEAEKKKEETEAPKDASAKGSAEEDAARRDPNARGDQH